MKTIETGTYSHGTLNPEHLADVAVQTLQSIQMDSGFELDNPSNPLREKVDTLLWDFVEIDVEHEHFWELWEEFTNLMDSLCPENHYFGSHPGDGSDIGVWEFDEEI